MLYEPVLESKSDSLDAIIKGGRFYVEDVSINKLFAMSAVIFSHIWNTI